MLNRSLILIAALGIGAAAAAQGDPQRDFVLAGKDAYMVMPPEFICGPSVKQIAWSPDGERLAIVREFMDISPSMISDAYLDPEARKEMPEPEMQLIEWSAVTRKAVTLLKYKATAAHIESLSWLAGSSSLVVMGLFQNADEPNAFHESVLIVSSSGKATELAQLTPTKQYEVEASPYRPVAGLVEHPAPKPVAPGVQPPPSEVSNIRFFGPEGTLSQPISFPSPLCFPMFSNNGRIYVLSFEKQPGAKSRSRVWYVIDREAQKVLPAPGPPPEGMEGITVTQEPITIQDLAPKVSLQKVGVAAPTIILFDKHAPDAEPSVVTTDGSNGELAPKCSAVSYQSQGSLMVRQMVKVPLEAMRRAREAARKASILSQAKQVALALLMYSNDYDDNYLSNQGNWQSQLLPYLKDSSLTDGFNYTFGGGNATTIANPADTVLGYIDGPGGRAVAYTDGHVKWIPTP